MMHSTTILCLLVGMLAGGDSATPTQEHSQQVAYELMVATQARDPSAYPLLEEVLADMTDQTYIYFRDARLKAFEYIEAMEERRSVPMLREVASLSPPAGDSLEATLDAIAISGALDTLVLLGDERAGELSRLHIESHPFVQISSLRHLKALEVWDATPAVEQLFCILKPTGDFHVEVNLAAAFLASSPVTTDGICPCMNRIREAFGEKFARARTESDPLLMSYERLDTSIESLIDRLACANPSEVPATWERPPEGRVVRPRELASGTWGFKVEGASCEDNPHTIEFSADGGLMFLRYSKEVDGQPPPVTTYHILNEDLDTIRMEIEGETRRTEEGDFVQWDWKLLTIDSYCWHRTDWQAGGCTQPAYRCGKSGEVLPTETPPSL